MMGESSELFVNCLEAMVETCLPVEETTPTIPPPRPYNLSSSLSSLTLGSPTDKVHGHIFSGRGRGFGRGGPMGGRGMPPMMRGRGMMRSPRGFGMRGFAPRAPRGLGRGGPPANSHGGPPPSTTPTSSAPAATPEDGAPITTTTSSSAPRGSFRGRGFFRGRGSFGGPGAPNNTTIPGTGPDPKPFRGNDRGSGGFRGRGRGFGGFSRPFNRNLLTPGQDNGNIAPVPSLKRNGPGGLPGPKRGRYDSGPPTRGFAPKPNYVQSNPSHMNHQYNQPQAAPNHSGYVQDGSHQQSMDPYAQSYQQAPQQSYTNNGYSQTGYTDPNAQTTTYPQTSGYEQQYQDYSSATTYGTQDTRYQYNNTQSYQSGYGTTTDTYNTAPQDPYQQSSYDESTYSTGYDANAYSQGSYQNTTGYY
uniref:Uncharacterized protein n=2 Tax=Lutzomyia longipalpis TaxID=7200 RepID=A0A1B0CNL3_LUTLO